MVWCDCHSKVPTGTLSTPSSVRSKKSTHRKDSCISAVRHSPDRHAIGATCVTDGLSQLQIVDLTDFLDETADQPLIMQMASSVRSSLESTGCLIVRNARVPLEKNEGFLDMMERYYAQAPEVKEVDCRPESGYQV
jgi:hypothetical protein